MRVLLDTNIVLRSSQQSSAHCAIARAATRALLRAGRTLCISSQTIYEFLAVATRPVAENGLGLAHADVAHRVTGKKIHDTRLVALMVVHDITQVLTFNVNDFKRFGFISPLPPEDVERLLASS